MRSDSDPIETQEWLSAFRSVLKHVGRERAAFLLQALTSEALGKGFSSTECGTVCTPYKNSISLKNQEPYPGDVALEQALEASIRWNAIVMVMRAKKKVGGVGGHLSSFASIATLYEVGLNHFFKGATEKNAGDIIFFQGHSSEGNYARAFLEGRITTEQLDRFRQEIGGPGLSSYPHPWLMPDFWQFATVSLGLGMLQGVYQARFLKYLQDRELQTTAERRVWVFCGDGEMDEPESIAGLSLAAREQLDNLTFVINCNLQRLDGLVRSNYKIIQELEGIFRGAGWNVIKVLWDSRWDEIFARDRQQLLLQRLSACVDGDLQTAYVRGGPYLREFLFNTPELKELIVDYSDADLDQLGRGAHDPLKIFAAYHSAVEHKGQPTVILAQGVKGYGLGRTMAEGRNVAHNHLDMNEAELKAFRKRFNLPLTDEQLLNLEYHTFSPDSAEMKYLHARRAALGGYLPARSVNSNSLTAPALSQFDSILKGSEERTMSTTMVLGRIVNILLKDAVLGARVVPIFSDEVRTFGMEALFRQVGIYAPHGQLYTPEDSEQFLYYKESKQGQILEEGITEAGCMASWIAAATSYAVHRYPMVAIFTYYSMFGFQRVGDLIWAAADMRARGFLIGATAGRTTLEGEGLQHQDGHSLLVAAQVPTCRAYDPAFGYEFAVIMQHGLKSMYENEQEEFYYITAMNERYVQPPMPAQVEEGIVRGLYLFQDSSTKNKQQVQLFGSGTILNEVIAAQKLLQEDFSISSNVFSVTSYSELRRDAQTIERDNMLHPTQTPKLSYVEQVMEQYTGPVVAVSDYVRAYADLIRPYLKCTYVCLGTDGFGRSDTRDELRRFFEVNRYYIVLAALYALAKDGVLPMTIPEDAIKKYQLNTDVLAPFAR